MDCAAPGAPKSWTITLPKGLVGHKVLRWQWIGTQVVPNEEYEQCVDLDFGGAGADHYVAPPKSTGSSQTTPTMSRSAPVPSTPAAPTPVAPGSDGSLLNTKTSQEPIAAAPGASSPVNTSTSSLPARGSPCSPGTYQCGSNGGFKQCDQGAWVSMQCAAGTSCHATGPTAIACI